MLFCFREKFNLLKEVLFLLTGRKQIGLLLTLGVRSCSFESGLPDLNYSELNETQNKKFS